MLRCNNAAKIAKYHSFSGLWFVSQLANAPCFQAALVTGMYVLYVVSPFLSYVTYTW